MTYKIMLLQRDSKTDPLWAPYKIISDSTSEMVEFETSNKEILENVVKELLLTIPKIKIKLIADMDFILDIVMSDE